VGSNPARRAFKPLTIVSFVKVTIVVKKACTHLLETVLDDMKEVLTLDKNAEALLKKAGATINEIDPDKTIVKL
jgi:hypothetical protein